MFTKGHACAKRTTYLYESVVTKVVVFFVMRKMAMSE